MSYTNKYYPAYKKLYPGVEITPEILAVLRASDRQMRRFEEELQAEGFESDNKKQTARFIPSREDSYERLVQDENCQFSDSTADVEDAVLRRETMRHLHRALAQLEAAELMLEKVTVLSREMIRVTLRNGMEIEQTVEQPKRRKFI